MSRRRQTISGEPTMRLQVTPPPVRLKAPVINVPPIDTSGMQNSYSQLAAAMQTLMAQQASILQALEKHAIALEKLATRAPVVNVEAAPAEARPKKFSVSVQKPNGERVDMDIRAK